MATVAVTFRILPDDVERDLESLKARIREILGASLRDLREQELAFGLRAIVAIALVSDAAGGADRLEEALSAAPGVGSVETVDVTLI